MNSQNNFSFLEEKLVQLLQNAPKLLILGIGENRMGDDGIGQHISFHLSQKINSDNVKIINGGIVPVERLDDIYAFKPQLMIMIDAVDSGKKPGEVHLYQEQQMMNYLPISSHTLPLPVFVERCRNTISGLEVKLLGIQPFSLQFLDHYKLFEEDKYSLDDKEANPNIPFYDFNLTEEIQEIGDQLIELLVEKINIAYSDA